MLKDYVVYLQGHEARTYTELTPEAAVRLAVERQGPLLAPKSRPQALVFWRNSEGERVHAVVEYKMLVDTQVLPPSEETQAKTQRIAETLHALGGIEPPIRYWWMGAANDGSIEVSGLQGFGRISVNSDGVIHAQAFTRWGADLLSHPVWGKLLRAGDTIKHGDTVHVVYYTDDDLRVPAVGEAPAEGAS